MDEMDPQWQQTFTYLVDRWRSFGKTPFDNPPDYFAAISAIGRTAKQVRDAPNEDLVRQFFLDAGWPKEDANKIMDWPQVAVGAVKA